jgi:hypothetical protein
VNAAFQMPEVYIGEVVLWWPDGAPTAHDRPQPAVITGFAARTVSLSIIQKDGYALTPHDGVRHIDDPDLRKHDVRLVGGWEHGPVRKMQEALATSLKEHVRERFKERFQERELAAAGKK